jgi:hypothetical protein
MRRICILLAIACLAVPAAAVAGGRTPSDGSLDVSGSYGAPGATGSLSLSGKGVVFGYVAHGTITVYAYKPDGNSVPTVSGAKMTLSKNAASVVYSGNGMRFLFPGGRYTLQIDGIGIDLSAVGNGSVTGVGAGTLTADTVELALGTVPTSGSWGAGAMYSAGKSG